VCASRGFDPLEVAAACLRGGARVLQLRVKEGRGAAFLDLARAMVRTAAAFDARIIVNDRADIARLSGAAGVHVGQDDLSVADVRGILGPDAIVGLSTHDPAQVDAALATTATYIAVGPVYVTGTKDTGYEPRGLDLVRYAAGRGRPVAAIGGITLARAPAVLAAGASTLAVITDLVAGEPEARTRAYLALAAAPERPDHRKNGPR
jgi:thiamine-phosphate pyrophosphorylase